MGSSVGLLDFFVLEAGEYVEQLDGLLLGAGAGGLDFEPFGQNARRLRGSATMAKMPAIAELAASLERVARALRDGAIGFDVGLKSALVASVDDLKILVRSCRTWNAADEKRAARGVAELSALVPVGAVTGPAPVQRGFTFFVSEAESVADLVAAFLTQPSSIDRLRPALDRIRRLRGVAAVKDVPPLADVVDALERAAKPMELRAASPGPEALALFSAAVDVLRRAAADMRAGTRPDVTAPEVMAFATAARVLESEDSEDADRIVPVGDLFGVDGGVVSSSTEPPTSLAQRFKLEVVSQAEHLRRLVADARSAMDPASRERLGRELRSALRALRLAAESFGEREVAEYVASSADAVVSLDGLALTALDHVATLLANPAATSDEVAGRLKNLARGRRIDSAIGAGFGATSEPPQAAATGDSAPRLSGMFATIAPPASAAAAAVAAPQLVAPQPVAPQPVAPRPVASRPAPSRPTPPSGAASGAASPSGRALHDLLESSIAGITRLDAQPLSPPADISEGALVPIEALLYRGRGALDRALFIRDAIVAGGANALPPALEELFDLLELAAAD